MPERKRVEGVEGEVETRFAIHRLASDGTAGDLAAGVRQGLTASPKFLSPKYLYDDLGSRLFAAICALPEYYLARVESEILAQHAAEILAELPGRLRVLELGSGDAEKTPLLLAPLLARQPDLHYLVIDVSGGAVRESSGRLLRSFPGLRMTGFVGEYENGLRAASREATSPGEHTLALFLGTSLGNLEPPEQRELLVSLRSLLQTGDGLLLGVDMEKPERLLLPAYDDPLGVTSAFNRNLLVRINRELGGRFDLAAFSHRARYDVAASRIEMHLVSRTRQRVAIRDLGLEVAFAEGETIHTESSYRYSATRIEELARATGFIRRREWFDPERRFGSFLLLPDSAFPPL